MATIQAKNGTQYRILLIGEVNAGKSSFIELLQNYESIQRLGFTKGVTKLDRIELESASAEPRKQESKTSAAKLYNVEMGGMNVGLIDTPGLFNTPGLGDTRGVEVNKKHIQMIIQALEAEEYVNCVCLLIDGRRSGMSAMLQAALREIVSILSKQVYKNVIVVLTHASEPCCFDTKSLQECFGIEIEKERILFIENPICSLKNAQKQRGNLLDKKITRILKRQFEEAGEVLEEMCDAMKDFKELVTRRYKMLLIGQVGAGKSSFINLLWNYESMQQLGFTERVMKLHDIELENAEPHKQESRTSDAKAYTVEMGGLNVGLIDTPGFGDARGVEVDKKHTQKIISALKREKYVNCICLIIDGQQSRVTAALQHVLTQISSILPKEVLNNVIVVFTRGVPRFDTKSLQECFQKEERMFIIENPICMLKNSEMQKGQLLDEKITRRVKRAFEETSEVLKEMCDTMKDFQEVHTCDAKPCLPELYRLPCKRRNVSVPAEIGSKYPEFGVLLLEDDHGSRVRNIAHRNREDGEKIVHDILEEWLLGRGKQPVTWQTLVEVLKDAKFIELAKAVELEKC